MKITRVEKAKSNLGRELCVIGRTGNHDYLCKVIWRCPCPLVANNLEFKIENMYFHSKFNPFAQRTMSEPHVAPNTANEKCG